MILTLHDNGKCVEQYWAWEDAEQTRDKIDGVQSRAKGLQYDDIIHRSVVKAPAMNFLFG